MELRDPWHDGEDGYLPHPEGETPLDGAHRERAERAARQAARAAQAIEAIRGGADPGVVSFALANEFTDETTARIGKWFGRKA